MAFETKIGNSKLTYTVRIYRQDIWLPEHAKLKLQKHLRTCGKENFTIFLLLQFRSSDTDILQEYEDYFIKKYKINYIAYRKES